MTGGRLRVFALWLTDILALVVSWLVALFGYRAVGLGSYEYGVDFYLSLWPVAIAFTLINAAFRLYHGNPFYPAAPLSPVEELRRISVSSILTHLGTLAALALAYQSTENYSRAVIVISGVVCAVIVQPLRDLVRLIMKKVGIFQIPVVFIGDAKEGSFIEQTVCRDPHTGFTRAERSSIAVICRDMRLLKLEMPDLLERFTHIEFVPGSLSFPTYGAQVVSLDGVSGLEMVNQRRMKTQNCEKAVLDIILSVFALILLSPFFLIVPVLIKFTSKGPVFYRQERLGRNGRMIRVWKFRSMYADADKRLKSILDADPVKKAEWEASFKLSDDPRITPFGRFLRKTSIDEFPQLFNVFTGDMALVGPRPIVEKEVAYYGESYETFASVKPGITGLWQASGRSDTDYARRVALDIHYVLNWSPWMDIWILRRTVSAVLFMRGAC